MAENYTCYDTCYQKPNNLARQSLYFMRVYFLILIHIRVCTGCKANNRCKILLATVYSVQPFRFFLLNKGEKKFYP